MCRTVIDDCEDAHARASELVLQLYRMRPSNELLRYRRFVISRDHEAWDFPESAPVASIDEVYDRFLSSIKVHDVYARAEVAEKYASALEDEIERLTYRLDETSCWGCGRPNTEEGESPG